MNPLSDFSLQALIHELPVIVDKLHFVRADWFYAFIPLILFLHLLYRSKLNSKNWQSVVDPQLMPFVLSQSAHKQRRYPLIIVFIAASLCITALSGPVYKKLPQPVYREQSSLVVLLDLSQSMNATDIKSSRLSRAKLKLLDLLKTRKAGQTALIVYAADAFVVTPLTDDNTTIANLVPSLETDMMPAQGSNLSSALVKTFSLFSQSGIVSGNILVITDGIHAEEESAIEKVFSQGHRLSILGIGTTEGGPIPLSDSDNGGFLQDSNGAIVIPKLYPGKLQSYALSGGGLYTSLQTDDSDIEKLNRLFQSSEIIHSSEQKDNADHNAESNNDASNIKADLWREEGHWLLLPLLLLAALWARRGWISAVLVFISISTYSPQPLYAAQATVEDTSKNTLSNTVKQYIDTDNLWFSADQKAMKAFKEGNSKDAAEKFTSPQWKASARYRSGDFQSAAKLLEHSENSDGLYNRGNALARLGQYEEAIQAYDKALELDENNQDATYNREQVEKELQKQKQENQQQDNKENSDQENSDKEKSDENKSDKSQSDNGDQQQNGEQKQSEKQDSEKQDGQQQDDQQSDSQQQEKSDEQSQQPESQKKSEDEQLKQRDAEAEAKQQQQEKENYQQDEKQQEESKQQEKDQPDQNQEAQADKAENNNAEEDKPVENREGEEKPAEIEANPVEASITEEQKATEQWLKRIPDDPGGLLRRKFYYQYKNIPNQTDTDEPW